jgi:hypothetical protein
MQALSVSIAVVGCAYAVWVLVRNMGKKRGRERYDPELPLVHHASSHDHGVVHGATPGASFHAHEHVGHDADVAACLDSLDDGGSDVADSSCDFGDFDGGFDDD